jgi:hypothetical protein
MREIMLDPDGEKQFRSFITSHTTSGTITMSDGRKFEIVTLAEKSRRDYLKKRDATKEKK